MSHFNKINVLMVDQAVTFGGSVIVMANLANNLPDDIGVSIVYEIPESDARYLFNDSIARQKMSTALDYRRNRKIKMWIRNRKSKLLRTILFKLYAVAVYLSELVQVLRLAKVILHNRIDIVHSNNSIAAFKAAKLLKRKVIGHLHGIGPIESGGLGRSADKSISISDYIKEQVTTVYGFSADKVVVVPNPVIDIKPDKDKVSEYMRKFNINENMKVFGLVGRIVDWKGQLQFLDAIPYVVEQLPQVKAMIIGDISDGDESYLREVNEKIKNLKIENNVVITGYIQDVHNAIGMLDLLVHCSIEPEPFGLVITEAMIQGIPVVGSDLGAPKEIIDDGETGFIVDPFDAKSMAENIVRLLSNDDLAKKFGERARSVALKKYDVSDYANQVAKIYRELCGS